MHAAVSWCALNRPVCWVHSPFFVFSVVYLTTTRSLFFSVVYLTCSARSFAQQPPQRNRVVSTGGTRQHKGRSRCFCNQPHTAVRSHAMRSSAALASAASLRSTANVESSSTRNVSMTLARFALSPLTRKHKYSSQLV